MHVKLISLSSMKGSLIGTSLPYDSPVSDKVLNNVWKAGHRSVVRHDIASFLVNGLSQSALRQLSRHPHINLTVKSSRYCDMSEQPIWMPSAVEREENMSSVEYEKDMKTIMEIYKKWKSYEGDKKEVDVAKQFLPLASTTDVVISGNIQALYEFLQLRNCVRAEEEIRQMSLRMTAILKEKFKGINIFDNLGCAGDEWGLCPETHKPCGKYPVKGELL